MGKDIIAVLNEFNMAIIQVRGAYLEWARANKLNYNELLIFYLMRDNPCCTQSLICNSYMLPKQTVHNVVHSLQERGILELVPINGNKKEKFLQLTPAGQEYEKEFMAPVIKAERKAIDLHGMTSLRNLTMELFRYAEKLNISLNKVYKNAHK